jgi:epsilon-lactone hydrolase
LGALMRRRDVMTLAATAAGTGLAVTTSGTRDLLLRSTVRVHRKLRQAGVEAALHIYEGQAHGHYLRDPNAPETRDAFDELARFFDKHLDK